MPVPVPGAGPSSAVIRTLTDEQFRQFMAHLHTNATTRMQAQAQARAGAGVGVAAGPVGQGVTGQRQPVYVLPYDFQSQPLAGTANPATAAATSAVATPCPR
jgi:hypothetical protein